MPHRIWRHNKTIAISPVSTLMHSRSNTIAATDCPAAIYCPLGTSKSVSKSRKRCIPPTVCLNLQHSEIKVQAHTTKLLNPSPHTITHAHTDMHTHMHAVILNDRCPSQSKNTLSGSFGVDGSFVNSQISAENIDTGEITVAANESRYFWKHDTENNTRKQA